jgi:cytochrome P450
MNKAAAMSNAFVEISKAYAGNLDDPYPMLERLRAKGAVYEGDILQDAGVPSIVAGMDASRKVYSLLGYDVVSKALLDSENFSSDIYREAFEMVMGGPVILFLKGDEHRFYRQLLMTTMSPNALRSLSDNKFKPLISSMVSKLVQNKSCELMADFILEFPLRIVFELFGLPSDDEDEIQAFSNRALIMMMGGLLDPSKPEEAQQRIGAAMMASQELYDQLLAAVEARRKKGDIDGHDLIAQLLRFEKDGETLSNEFIAQFLRPTLAAAGETTSRGFSVVMAVLLDRPELLERVRGDRSLIPSVINEAMRLESSVSVIPRVAANDIEVGGVKIPAGAGVNIVVSAANRDPKIFNKPDEFSLEKRAKQGLAFGFGPHMCMGMMLARMEMEIALNVMLDMMPGLRLDPSQQYEGIKGVHFRSPITIPVIWD